MFGGSFKNWKKFSATQAVSLLVSNYLLFYCTIITYKPHEKSWNKFNIMGRMATRD